MKKHVNIEYDTETNEARLSCRNVKNIAEARLLIQRGLRQFYRNMIKGDNPFHVKKQSKQGGSNGRSK